MKLHIVPQQDGQSIYVSAEDRPPGKLRKMHVWHA